MRTGGAGVGGWGAGRGRLGGQGVILGGWKRSDTDHGDGGTPLRFPGTPQPGLHPGNGDPAVRAVSMAGAWGSHRGREPSGVGSGPPACPQAGPGSRVPIAASPQHRFLRGRERGGGRGERRGGSCDSHPLGEPEGWEPRARPGDSPGLCPERGHGTRPAFGGLACAPGADGPPLAPPRLATGGAATFL